MQKATDTAITLLHFGTLSETVALLNEGHFSTALWHAFATGGIVLIIVTISALTYIIANKAAKVTRKKSTRKSSKRKSAPKLKSRNRVNSNKGN